MAKLALISENDPLLYLKDLICFASTDSPCILYIGEENARFVMFENAASALSCRVQRLPLDGTASEIAADIVVVDTANAARLMRILRKYGVDRALLQTSQTDMVVCGIAEGGVCLCNYGISATDKLDFHRVRGVGLFSAVFCPHCLDQSQRTGWLKSVMKRTPRITGLAVDHAAVLVTGDSYCTVCYAESARVRKCYWFKRQYFTDNIKSVEWHTASKLLCKGDFR